MVTRMMPKSSPRYLKNTKKKLTSSGCGSTALSAFEPEVSPHDASQVQNNSFRLKQIHHCHLRLVFFLNPIELCPMKKFRLAVIAIATISGAGFSEAQDSSWQDPAWQASTWNARGCSNDNRGQWFRDAKFGAFIHFGLYSQLGGYWQGKGPYDAAEQIIGLGQRKVVIPADQYRKDVGGMFNPTNFNAHKWVSAIKQAGQKYLIVTTKHHDGFCMFRTATTSYNVVEATPFARDIIRELADECKKQGIEFCPYYSIGDWCAADVP